MEKNMSHTIDLTTPATTAVSGPRISFNLDYLRATPGLLKLGELLLGMVCVSVIGHHFTSHDIFYDILMFQSAKLFFIVIAGTFFIGTFSLLSTCLMSPTSATIISRTEFEIIYHGLASVLYLVSSLTLLIECNRGRVIPFTFIHAELDITPYVVASVIGFLTSITYMFSTYFAYKIYRGNE